MGNTYVNLRLTQAWKNKGRRIKIRNEKREKTFKK